MMLVGGKLNSAEGSIGMLIILKLSWNFFLMLRKPFMKLKQFQNSV